MADRSYEQIMLPESPRYLLLKGRESAARVSLGRLLNRSADSPEVEAERLEIVNALQREQSVGASTYVDCFRNTENKNGLRTWTGIMLQGVCGFSFCSSVMRMTCLFCVVATTDRYQLHLYVFSKIS